MHAAVKAKLSVEVAVQVDELVGYELETFIPHMFSTTGGKYSKIIKLLDTKFVALISYTKNQSLLLSRS